MMPMHLVPLAKSLVSRGRIWVSELNASLSSKEFLLDFHLSGHWWVSEFVLGAVQKADKVESNLSLGLSFL
jgi:hypothetical protein